MNDENTEEKKPEEEAPTNSLIKKIEEIESAARENKTKAELRVLFDGLFAELTDENWFPVTKRALKYFVGLQSILEEKDLLKEFWLSWGDVLKEPEKLYMKSMYFLPEMIFFLCNETNIRNLYTQVFAENWNFRKLRDLAIEQHYSNPVILNSIGTILEKLGIEVPALLRKGRDFRTRAQVLFAKDELKQEFLETVDKKLKQSKMELDNKVKGIEVELKKIVPQTEGKIDERIKEQERNSIRNFVQIIGIFAAIIAFIVTMVPASIRLGGASIPVALAGLAIVTAGIIVLLAMIFGRDERRKSLSKGLTGIIIAFILWLTLTVVLAFVEPNVLAPPERVDTLYIDTVESRPPPTPLPDGGTNGIEEGE